MYIRKLLERLFPKRWLVAVLCLPMLSEPAHSAAVTVVDGFGRRIEIARPVQRIVALNSDVIEVLRTLKAEEYIVGVFSEMVREPEFWGDVAKKPKVGSWRAPDLEAIAALKPDLVIAYCRTPGPVLEQKMSLFDIKVLRMDFFKLDTLGAEVQALGILLNREREATWFCEWHQRHCNMIRKRLEGIVSHPPVYVESYTDYHAVGPGSGGHEMCVRAGGRNIAAELSIPYPRVTPEWVLSQNPVVIIKAASYGNGYARADSTCFNKLRDALLSRPAWEHISAVATGKVHVMDSAIWTGPRCCIGLAYMARWFYPDLFPDLDPVSLHKEYLELFQRIPYQGIFVSDEIGGRGR